MAITATLTVPGNIIAGAVTNMVLTITNAAASDVTVSSISPVVIPGTVSCTIPPPVFPPNKSSTVTASGGTLSVPLQAVFYLPQTAGDPRTQPGSDYLLSVAVQVSDGSQASSPQKWISVSAGAPTPSQGYGQLRFDDGRNAVHSL